MKRINKSILLTSALIVCVAVLLGICQYQKSEHITRIIDVFNYNDFSGSEMVDVHQAEVAVVLKNRLFEEVEITGSITIRDKLYQFNDEDVQEKNISEGVEGYCIYATAFYKDKDNQDAVDFIVFEVSKAFDIVHCYDEENGNLIGPAKSLEEAEALYERFYAIK